MSVTLFVRSLASKENPSVIRQIQADQLCDVAEFIQDGKACLQDPDLMNARVEVESLLGCITTGPILVMIDCEKK